MFFDHALKCQRLRLFLRVYFVFHILFSTEMLQNKTGIRDRQFSILNKGHFSFWTTRWIFLYNSTIGNILLSQIHLYFDTKRA
ncbi:hypothetical protein D3C87_1414770 [compost metagenome]